MQRQRKPIAAKMAVVLLAIPLIVWAYEFGPDAGYSGVPNEAGTCASSQCHIGTVNNPANKGSVAVSFPNGTTYTPGVKQHLTVTISDPAQHAWGFQLTARLASNSSNMAGTLTSSDANTLLMCANGNLSSQQGISFSAGSPQVCPSGTPLQYIEHSSVGYFASRGQANSGTYEFDWIPPATDVGGITVYVSGNAANGDLTNSGDHIYNTNYTLTPSAGGTNNPAIAANGVVSGASFQPGIVPGSWLTIQGSNLSSVIDTWEKAIVNGQLPPTLDGVSVNVGGKPAFVYFISPGQINVQAPDVGAGPVPVTVTNANGTSTAFTATVVQQAPAFFVWPGSQTVATRLDASLAVKAGTFAGAATVAAKPGDVLVLWGTGFGPTTPSVAAGIQVPIDQVYFTASPVSIKIGTVDVQQFGCALSPGFAGLYQVAVQVPASMADGDYPIVATVAGVSSPDGVILSVKK
jgi:uncharacterized protein (TIGR03437 family)